MPAFLNNFSHVEIQYSCMLWNVFLFIFFYMKVLQIFCLSPFHYIVIHNYFLKENVICFIYHFVT